MLLTSALDLVEQQDAATCGCCGQLRTEAHDPSTEGRWQPVVVKCYAGDARRDFLEKHRDEIGDDLVGMRLLPEGASATDPLEYDPAAARREYEELQQRHGAI